MYPYNEVPPSSNPNQPGAYPPPPYSYPPESAGYYRPQPPFRRGASDVWRVIGIIALIWFVGALLVGHHGFLWFVILAGAFFYFRSRGRHGFGGRRGHRYHNSYYQQPRSYDTGYYYPPQNPSYNYRPQPQAGNSGWPTPNNPSDPEDQIR